jgi:hypothetical protein
VGAMTLGAPCYTRSVPDRSPDFAAGGSTPPHPRGYSSALVPRMTYGSAPHEHKSATTVIMSAVAGIVAAALIAFLALLTVLTALDPPSMDGPVDWMPVFLFGLGSAYLVASVLPVVGSVLLLLRRLIGRWLIAAALTLVAIGHTAPFILSGALTSDASHEMRLFALSTVGNSIMTTLLAVWVGTPLVALVFAFLPPTRRYCTRNGNRAAVSYGDRTEP